jgi:hypothetical protein
MLLVGNAPVATEYPESGSPADSREIWLGAGEGGRGGLRATRWATGADGDRCALLKHAARRYRPVQRYGSSAQRGRGT